jgi:hypothetical protein
VLHDKFRGRELSSFGQFRKAFWLAVSEDMELLKGFNRSNQRLIKRGNAPFCVEDDAQGGRERFKSHHIKEIQYGGEVYDVDNLSLVTPRRHIDIHKGL